METAFKKLYYKCRPDLAVGAVKLPRPRDLEDDSSWRLRGFVFMVNGSAEWAPAADTDTLLRVGRWVAGWEQFFVGGYKTDRTKGFVICFSREDDARTMERQCLANPEVFTGAGDGPMQSARVLSKRSAKKQLPSGALRSLSQGLSERERKRYCYVEADPKGGFVLRSLAGTYSGTWLGEVAWKARPY
ncbi:hypothetical protein FN976_28360 [Caenimonas sedimenti]|uniref:Uncharacterized protein n=1 Tax=Caenimonas sedimenti TaxID=2596921 RepID=A0A562ZDU0_9BURK|nr:hypothetical protein [Caenimonas sedimenti]TWO64001.1 hypothetical protein FN976_28360 [Caenimonas sedimenti]